jgi:hypothetical protein
MTASESIPITARSSTSSWDVQFAALIQGRRASRQGPAPRPAPTRNWEACVLEGPARFAFRVLFPTALEGNDNDYDRNHD